MKFFKSTLVIVALLVANPVFAARSTATAKPAGKTTTTKVSATSTKKAPANVPAAGAASLSGTYSEMLAQIRNMPANQVVDNAKNTLQPAFVQSITDNMNLSGTEAEALLQAAVNMHATWSDNDAKDKAKLQSLTTQVAKNAQQIKNVQATMGKQKSLMQSMLPTLGHVQAAEKAVEAKKAEAKLQEAQDLLAQLQAKAPKNLRDAENLLLQVNPKLREATQALGQLESMGSAALQRAEAALKDLQTKSAQQKDATAALNRLVKEGPATLQNAERALMDLRKTQLTTKQSAPTGMPIIQPASTIEISDMDFVYDPATNLLTNDALQVMIKDLLDNTDKTQRTVALFKLQEKAFDLMLPEWKKRNINADRFKLKLVNQIDNAYKAALKAYEGYEAIPVTISTKGPKTLTPEELKAKQEALFQELGGEEEEFDPRTYQPTVIQKPVNPFSQLPSKVYGQTPTQPQQPVQDPLTGLYQQEKTKMQSGL